MKKLLLLIILAFITQTINAQVPSYVATNGLIGYWPFNGNANDESGNGKNGVKFQVAETTDRFGNLNSAYSFDGISSYIEVANSAGFDLGGNDFTISVWVNFQEEISNSAVNLISKSSSGLVLGNNDGDSSGLPNTNVKYGVGFDTYGKGYGIYPDILPKSGWNHIVCVKTSSGYDYYINSQKYTLPFNRMNVSKTDINNPLFFGKKNYFVGFKGILDDIAIYNRALSQQEITNLEQADAFITTWVTTTGFETITLSAQADAPNYSINWGDGFSNTYTATQAPSHTYINSGEHTVSFTGTFPHLMFNEKTKLKAVQQWGTQKWTSMAMMFQSCANLNSFPSQLPDLSLCTDMSYMFNGATAFNQDISTWNVSNVTNMSNMFNRATVFNQPIGSWNVSKVTNMNSMFGSTNTFNQAIGSWNVSNVTNMSGMFSRATSFNQAIGSWDVRKVIDMSSMFNSTKYFNQPIESWNVGQVTNMSGMFNNSYFDQPIGNWDVSKVTNMTQMFLSSSFNQSIGSWNVSQVANMLGMFSGKLSTANYDATLTGWSTRAANGGVKQGVSFDGGASNYCNSLTARNYLINTFGWQITDGGANCTSYYQQDAFITTWQTATANETLNLPAQPDAPLYTIDWGDGSATNTYTAVQAPSHKYLTAGDHTLTLFGNFPHLIFQGQSKLKAVQQWGTQKWTSMANMFRWCNTFNSFPTQAPDLTLCTDMSYMFSGALSFNQPIGSWNVSQVNNMSNMFGGDDYGCAFNQPIGSWDVSKVTNMSNMFSYAKSFNQHIGSWNVSNVTNMSYMFSYAKSFNQHIGSWNVANVANMSGMFRSATTFNQPIGSWNVSKVINMGQMFQMASSYNQPLGSWNVSQVTDMSNMFAHSSSFNQPLGSWNVSNVTNMSWMFGSQLNDTPFNQEIGSWNISNVANMSGMFYGAKLSTANYDATLIGWASKGINGGTLKQKVTFTGGASNYCNGLGARNFLTNTYGWIITDGGVNCTGLGTEEFDKSSLNLYPNPTSSVLNIKADATIANQPYTLTDALGKIVLRGKLNEGETTINVEHLSKGIYYIKLATNKVSKFIKE